MSRDVVRFPLAPAWLRWSALACVAGAIFYLSVVTAPPETPVDTVRPGLAALELDKWRHFVAYAAFAGALAYATADRDLRTRDAVLLVVGVTAVYGFGIELLQWPLPTRYFSPGDALANVLGGVLVVPLVVLGRYVAFVPVGEWVRPGSSRGRNTDRE